ncbi:A24 family peptidase [soil metagenome]
MTDIVLAGLCGLTGLAVGVGVNTVIDRVPDKRPLRPLAVACSACGDASSPLGGAARRRCGSCGQRRPLSELMVPLATAALYVVAALRFGTTWVLVPYLVLFAALVAVSVIDLRWFRIPDRIVFPTLAVSVPLVVVVSLAYDVPSAIAWAVIGAVVYFLALFVPHLVYPEGMGFGDVKLALVMGLYLGWLATDRLSSVYLVVVSLMLGCGLGVVFGVAVRLVTRRDGAFPFGPALAAATVVVVVFSEPLVRNYLGV